MTLFACLLGWWSKFQPIRNRQKFAQRVSEYSSTYLGIQTEAAKLLLRFSSSKLQFLDKSIYFRSQSWKTSISYHSVCNLWTNRGQRCNPIFSYRSNPLWDKKLFHFHGHTICHGAKRIHRNFPLYVLAPVLTIFGISFDSSYSVVFLQKVCITSYREKKKRLFFCTKEYKIYRTLTK